MEVHYLMLHNKYQGLRPWCFRQEDFFHVFLYKPLFNMRPPGRGHFGSQGHYLDQLGRGLLGDATYQISAQGLVVLNKKSLSCVPYNIGPLVRGHFGHQ